MTGPHLPLTEEEKRRLKRAKVRMGDLHPLSEIQLATLLQVSDERARELKALATFQRIPSIGPKMATTLVKELHVFSLEEVKNQNPAHLFDRLEKNLGMRLDPCVEDQIRCVVNYANNPDSPLQWFDFTEERKKYRSVHGYPIDRPK